MQAMASTLMQSSSHERVEINPQILSLFRQFQAQRIEVLKHGPEISNRRLVLFQDGKNLSEKDFDHCVEIIEGLIMVPGKKNLSMWRRVF